MSTTGFVLTALLASSLATLCGLAALSRRPPKEWIHALGFLLLLAGFASSVMLDADLQFAANAEYKFTRVFVMLVFADMMLVKYLEWRLNFPRCFRGEQVTTDIFAGPIGVVALCIVCAVFGQ